MTSQMGTSLEVVCPSFIKFIADGRHLEDGFQMLLKLKFFLNVSFS